MKKLIKFVSVFTLTLSIFAIGILPVSASTSFKTKDITIVDGPIVIKKDINEQFFDLQKKIDSALTIADGQYIYNAEEIRNIITRENFNFARLNIENGTSYTEESFITAVLNAIETTVNPVAMPSDTDIHLMAASCNKNATSSGWNYNRTWADNYNSGTIADRLEQAADNWGLFGAAATLTGFIPVIGSFIAAGMGLGSGFNAWYSNTLARSIRVNMSGCGTVIDINKFTTAFSVWDQRKF